MKTCVATAAAILLGLVTLPAQALADPITFDGLSGSLPTYTEAGVTFAAEAGNLSFQQTPNGTIGVLGAAQPYSQIRASLLGVTSSVSVDLGDYNGDDDLLVLRGYDSLNNLIGLSSLLIPSEFTGMKTLSLNAPKIAYVIFGAEQPALNGSSVFADNFTFSDSAPVPEPGSLILLSSGLLGTAIHRWKRRSRPLVGGPA